LLSTRTNVLVSTAIARDVKPWTQVILVIVEE
jgi:hypothetical protein